MKDRAGAIISFASSIAFLAVLVWPYLVLPPSDITAYYSWGALNPLFAGVLVVVILLVLAAVRANRISARLGAGISIGLGLFVFLHAIIWALTARLDLFRAEGWALPAQRFILVGISLLMLLGFGWYAWEKGIRPWTDSPTTN